MEWSDVDLDAPPTDHELVYYEDWFSELSDRQYWETKLTSHAWRTPKPSTSTTTNAPTMVIHRWQLMYPLLHTYKHTLSKHHHAMHTFSSPTFPPPLNTTSYTLLPRAHTPPPLASQQHMVPHTHTHTHTHIKATQTKPTHTGYQTHPCNVNKPYCLPTLLYLQCSCYWTNRCTLNTCMIAVVLYPFCMLLNILLI